MKKNLWKRMIALLLAASLLSGCVARRRSSRAYRNRDYSAEELEAMKESRQDLDRDGLEDYDEVNLLNYNPNSKDSDRDGVPDADEDYDGDGLTNRSEAELGTSLVLPDTDSDGLNDFEEATVYRTDPLLTDTDEDGAGDFEEIMIGTDPLVPETRFVTAATAGSVDALTPVAASATAVTSGEGANTLQIRELTTLDNALLNTTIPGYLGSAYDFSVGGDFISGELTFTYDPSLGTVGDGFEPRIYYFDEETGLLEELPDQIVENGSVKAAVSHFSTYILLNKVEFDRVWEEELTPFMTSEKNGIPTVLQIAFVIDYSLSMVENDPDQTFKELTKSFIARLRDGTDEAAVIEFIAVATLLSDLTTNKDALIRTVESIEYDDGHGKNSGTNGSDGIRAALEVLTNRNQTEKSGANTVKYIIFMTDGQDTKQSYSYDLLAKKAAYSNIRIYTIGLGSAEDAVLRSVAEKTGGKYYYATTAEELPVIYENISEEVADTTTDSNGDGISDYYADLINKGKLTYSSGATNLVGVLDIYGEESVDWDGDGLLNGEEIEIGTETPKPHIVLYSNPLLKDSDGDGYDDFTEIQNKTNPLKWTMDGDFSLTQLEDDKSYNYVSFASENGGNYLQMVYWKSTEEAKQYLINYFFDYAPQEMIDKNAESIAKLQAREQYQKWFEAAVNLVKAIKDIKEIYDSCSDMLSGDKLSSSQKTYVRNLSERMKNGTSKVYVFADSEEKLQGIMKNITVAINNEKFDPQNNVSVTVDILDILDGVKDVYSDCREMLDSEEVPVDPQDPSGQTASQDWAENAQKLTSVIQKLTGITSSGTSLFSTVRSGVTIMKLSKTFHGAAAFSKDYQKFIQAKGFQPTAMTYIGIAIDVADCANSIWEASNTYGKMQANRDAYLAYIDLLAYIADHSEYEYIQNASFNLKKIIMDESWEEYEKQLLLYDGALILETGLDIAFTLAAKANPYVALAKLCVEVVKAGSSFVGIGEYLTGVIDACAMQAVSSGCISIIKGCIYREELSYISIQANDAAYVRSYIVQLAQSRIVGEKVIYELAKDPALRMQVDPFFSKDLARQDFVNTFNSFCQSVFMTALSIDSMHGGLQLSSNCPGVIIPRAASVS